jgi:LysR family positive regulator for ilvC
VLQRFRRTHPGIHLQLETGYAVEALHRLDEGTDVVVAVLDQQTPAELEQRIIRSVPLLALGPSADCEVARLLAQPPVDWSRVPLILPSTGSVRSRLDAWLHTLGVRASPYSLVDGSEATVSLVAMGCGVGFVPELVVETSPLRCEVRVLDDGPELGDIHVGFCTRGHRLRRSPLVQALWQCL